MAGLNKVDEGRHVELVVAYLQVHQEMNATQKLVKVTAALRLIIGRLKIHLSNYLKIIEFILQSEHQN
jgi:hypothetical protein